MSDPVFKSESAAQAVMNQYRQVLDNWPVPNAQVQVQTRFGQTFVLACGPEDAPPVVLLHGSQANSAAWLADVPLWASRFRLYAIDVIGEAGLSARLRPDLAGDDHANWLDEVFTQLDLHSFALVGTSLGGWLALDYAKRKPAAITAMALMCPAGIGRQKNFLLSVAPLLLLGHWGMRRIREKIFGPETAIPAALQPMAELMETIGRAFKPRIISIPQLSDVDLARLTMPFLAIVGGRDALIDSADTRGRLQAKVPQAEIAYIEDGYHFLPGQTERVMAFLVGALG